MKRGGWLRQLTNDDDDDDEDNSDDGSVTSADSVQRLGDSYEQ